MSRDFLTSVLRTSGYEHQLGNLTLRDRVVEVDTFPMGVEFDRFAQAATSKETELRVEELRQKCVGQKVIFSVDRLDYTKGLINRLRGYETFLKNNPQWHGKVVFIISVAPSRIGVDSYQAMKLELEQTVGRIVGDFGNVHWTPLVYQFRNLTFDEIVPLYRLCDVALITPLRDGMNLVAKEFIASRPDQTGVLILSEMAGAAKEMGEALIINPFHREDFAKALEQALTMPVEEQIRRNQLLQERLRRYNVVRWADDFVQALMSTQKTEAARRARLLTGKAYSGMIQQYRSAARRALLLDYDGTLVPFAAEPKLAQPDAELIETAHRARFRPGQPSDHRQRTSAPHAGGMVRQAADFTDRRTRRLAAQQRRRLADVENHDRRLEGARASDSPALRGPSARRAAGGKGIFARVALPPRRPGTGFAAREGTARRPGRLHAQH